MTQTIRSALGFVALLVIFIVVEAKIHNDPSWIVDALRPAWVWTVDVTRQITAPVQ